MQTKGTGTHTSVTHCPLCVCVCAGVYRALAIEVFTPKELTAVNGTNVRLKCTFKSSHPVSESKASVSWSFKPFNLDKEEQVRRREGKVFADMSAGEETDLSFTVTGSKYKETFTFIGVVMYHANHPVRVFRNRVRKTFLHSSVYIVVCVKGGRLKGAE